MRLTVPILPIAVAAPTRAALVITAFIARLGKQIARALRHRREASALAHLDRYMLADIGITRGDLNDAFSEPFWEDPTALLRERALERRLSRRGVASTMPARVELESVLRRESFRPVRRSI